MNQNLWAANTSQRFWQCLTPIEDEIWECAVLMALPDLQLEQTPMTEGELLQQVLGEGQFGPGHWQLSRMRRLYYDLKPFIPRILTRGLRRLLQSRHQRDFNLGWPAEERYPLFQFDVLRRVLELSCNPEVHFKPFWPGGKPFAFVLTHDVEEDQGQAFIRTVAELEESMGFRSSFNFVPERYHIDGNLIGELRERGFEVGVHGLKHDGKLFRSQAEFARRAVRINHHIKALGAAGFRSPLTLRNPEWMQALEIQYDSSFFDTDPFEPQPGGTMSIWPFFIGHFVELPYTLIQDHTLTSVLGETTPRMWLGKVEFIKRYQGMALLNSHPDYLRNVKNLEVYGGFLSAMRARDDYWHDLPSRIAAWWQNRADVHPRGGWEDGTVGCASLLNDQLVIEMRHGIHSYAPMS